MTRLATVRFEERSAVARLINGEAEICPDIADVGALLRNHASSATWTPVPVDELEFLRPVLSPRAVVCVGLNYRTHIVEMGREIPAAPTYFSKLARALCDPDDEVVLPASANDVDYEGEVAIVIGRAGRFISRSAAWEHIAGFTLLNDITVRAHQRRTTQWFAGKSWQSSTPVGPFVAMPDALPPPPSITLRTYVNGELRQEASLGDLVFDPAALVSDLSEIVELLPGDLIATGTPGGVGEAMEPRQMLEPGDEVVVSADGLGELRCRIGRQP